MANEPQYTKAEAIKAAKAASAEAIASIQGPTLYDDADAVGLTASTLSDDDEKPRAAAKPAPKPVRVAAAGGRPENLIPASFSKPVRPERDEVGDLIDKYVLNEPARPTPRPSVATSQDKVEQGLARVTDPSLTQVQRTETFINELASNPHFAARFGVNANSAGKLDLNGDRQVEPREYEAVANTLWRDARFKSIEKIAETLGNDKQIAAAARSFGGTAQEGDGGSKLANLILPQGDPDKGGHHR